MLENGLLQIPSLILIRRPILLHELVEGKRVVMECFFLHFDDKIRVPKINYKIINQFSGQSNLIWPSAPPTATIDSPALCEIHSADSSYFCIWTATSLIHRNSLKSHVRNVPSWLTEYSSLGSSPFMLSPVTASEWATKDLMHLPMLVLKYLRQSRKIE